MSALATKVVVSVIHAPPVGTLPMESEPLDEKAAPALAAVTHRMAPIAIEVKLWMLDICTVALMPEKPTVDVQYCMKFCP